MVSDPATVSEIGKKIPPTLVEAGGVYGKILEKE